MLAVLAISLGIISSNYALWTMCITRPVTGLIIITLSSLWL